MANRRRDAAKEANWRKVLERFSISGLSIRAFCQREQIPEPAFYAWRRTIAERDGARTAEPAFARSPDALLGPGKSRDAARTAAKPAFVPVTVTKPAARQVPSACEQQTSNASERQSTSAIEQPSSLTLELPGGCVLRVSGPLAAEQLADLIVALQARCAR